MPDVVCVSRGSDEIDSGIEKLDETKVQLLFTKFPVGTGTFKRNKFLYVQYIGPRCGIVKRGQGISQISAFADANMHGVAGFSTTDKASLSFESLVVQFRNVFITDNGTFSMDQIRDEYRSRLLEEQRMMHKEGQKVKKAKPPPPKPPQVQVKSAPKKKESIPTDPKELSVVTKRVMEALREDNGAVNWAIFAADPTEPRVVSYGRGGIFEMVKNLPADQWLFGLFRISFFTGGERERRMIFFQWIGSKLKAVRSPGTAGVYPGMAKMLAPFSYEIYLVGESDLNAQAIISKSKNAFGDSRKKNGAAGDSANGVSGGKEMASIVFTEDNYKESLEDEQQSAVPFEVFQVKRARRNTLSAVEEGMEQSVASLGNTMSCTTPENFDIAETLELVKSKEGGLVWAIFEVR